MNSFDHLSKKKMNFISHDLLEPVLGLLSLLLLYYLWSRKSKGKGISPPEPVGAWPLIGHLHLLGGRTPVARDLAAWADKYGPVFIIRHGMQPELIVSNWESVKECFTTNDKAFCKRPSSSAGKYLGYNDAAFGFAHGPYWREVRKLVLLQVLSSRRIEALKHVRTMEIQTSIKKLYRKINRDQRLVDSKEYQEFDRPSKKVVMSQWFEHLSLNIIVRMIAGKRYSRTEEARSFRKVMKEFMRLSGQFVLSDAVPLPLLSWIDFQGHIKSMKRISKELSVIAESWIDEHVNKNLNGELGNEQDFIDVMLSAIDDKFTNYGHSKETIIKATIMNIILAGSDTTSVHLTWILSLLVNNREVMKRAQEEIDVKVGKERWVDESDIKNLVYLQAIVKETLRLFPPGPLAVPHEAMEDCHVGGYFIPKGTRLMVNVWKLHRDPRIWSEPDEFIPERFLTSNAEVDYLGQHFEFTPFGSGRRSCPGIKFAMQVTHLTIAQLLQGFDFTPPLNMPVDMTEGHSLTLPRAKPLKLVVTARLPSGFYLKSKLGRKIKRILRIYLEDHYPFRQSVKHQWIKNIILAGSDTTSVHLTWILSLLVNNRGVMKRAQEEIDVKVGKERWVDESDIKNLVYLQAIVKETLRLFPPGPLAVPHEAMEDCHVGGYFIPKGTRLMVNVWKLHRDPRIWSEPDEFIPERFLTSNAEVDYLGQHFEFTPFGSGRRSCPGITFAMQVTHLTLAQLLQGFDFNTPLNKPVDMTEGLSITLPKADPLKLLVTARLPSNFYEN